MRNSFNKSRINQSTLFNAKAMLYPYQNETVDNIDKLMEEGFNFKGQVILPTGAGKTKIMEYLIGYFINKASGPLCFATYCHRLMLSNNLLAREINAYVNTFGMKKLTVITLHSNDMKEFITKLNEENQINVTWYKDGEKNVSFTHFDNDTDVEFREYKNYNKNIDKVLKNAYADGRDVMFAVLYHSMDKLIGSGVEFDFAFYDEAHITTSTEFFGKMKDIVPLSNINLFFTATKTTDHDGFDMNNEEIYGKEIINKKPFELVEGKFITPIKLIIMDLLDEDNKIIEYTEDQKKVYHQLNAIMSVFDSHTNKIHNDSKDAKEPILFVSVGGNKILEEIINPKTRIGKKFKSWRINYNIDLYTTSAELKGYIDYFEDDDHDLKDLSKDDFVDHLNKEVTGKRKTIIIQIDQLTEGIDLPCINGALNLRSNGKNPAKFLQFIGRAVRRDDADRKLVLNEEVKWNDEDKFVKPTAYVYMATNTNAQDELSMQIDILEHLYKNYGDIIFKSTFIEKMNGTDEKVPENPDINKFNDNTKEVKNVNIKKYMEYLINLVNVDHTVVDMKVNAIRNYIAKLSDEEVEVVKKTLNKMSGVEEVYKYLISTGAI